MLVDVDAGSGAVRLDEEGLAALLAAAREPHREHHPELAAALIAPSVVPALEAVARPLATLELVVAGPDTRLVHRGWLSEDLLALALTVRDGLHQVMASDPAFLTAGLVRLTRMGPRKVGERQAVPFPAERLPELVDEDPARRGVALAETGAGHAWRLRLSWDGGSRELWATDGPQGLFLADPVTGTLRPTTPTWAYRILSVALPSPADLPA